MRVKRARLDRGLSLRAFAKEVGVHFTALAHIERGRDRYPPKKRLKEFAKALSITPEQLEALIAVERRDLNPHVLLPEISPLDLSQEWIENKAEKILTEYRRVTNRFETDIPVRIERLIAKTCGLSTKRCDFEKEKEFVSRQGGMLYGGLYPEGFRGIDRLVVVNKGRIRGKRLSEPEVRVTIAHEAGHYVLHCGNKEAKQLSLPFTKGPTFCREAECEEVSFSPLEYQASAFGACLLMPPNQFVGEWERLQGDKAKLAKAFEVTEAFVRLRARMLDCE